MLEAYVRGVFTAIFVCLIIAGITAIFGGDPRHPDLLIVGVWLAFTLAGQELKARQVQRLVEDLRKMVREREWT